MKLRVAILGASGIGKYHLREFKEAGCDIVAILGSSKESVKKTCDTIKRDYGLLIKGYSDIDELLSNEDLNIVSICTPVETHYKFSKKCLENGLNVLCEKPLLHNENIEKAEELVNLAGNHQKIFTVNTQWPSVFEKIEISGEIEKFEFYSEPGELGYKFLSDHMPHANSMLVKLVPRGKFSNLKFNYISSEELVIEFNYGECNVKYHFKYRAERPRGLNFMINSKKYIREIGENYSQKLASEENDIEIEDPLKISITKFINAIKNKGKPLILAEEIIENVLLEREIMTEYDNFIKNLKGGIL